MSAEQMQAMMAQQQQMMMTMMQQQQATGGAFTKRSQERLPSKQQRPFFSFFLPIPSLSLAPVLSSVHFARRHRCPFII